MKKIIVVLAALVLMAGSAYAAEWNFYGQARLSTFWSETDEISGPDGDVQYSEGLHSISRIGATVKVSDELIGRFEYGTGVNLRLLYGEWDFGAGKLKVGQDYTPLNWIISTQAYYDVNLLQVGGVYSHRHPQIGLTFGDFKVAFRSLENSGRTKTTFVNNNDDAFDGDIQLVIPVIEATYELDFDMVTLIFGAGYSTFEVTDNANGIYEEDVDSYVLALGGQFDMAGFYMKGDVYYGQNAGNLIWISVVDNGTSPDDGFAQIEGGELLDNECLGFSLIAGYRINDTFTVEAGYGYTQTELDHSDDNESATYYINTTITLAPGVFITPEIGLFDGKDSGDMEKLYYGLKWQINF
ncbi:hypothetical protein DO021_22040 [Desulfobacter hydrogenophilus]|uniref:Porin n=1 Tax=Desulfobacter hydrogenophilus TaxID=2291 RepID=A0A328F6N6_9BACT|nr:hypothetical protein [Desulfobacter hydrogenophilus]NDY74555.1 hypothetical protein [Desulfobacter hydrogenophilus]QBH14585.1 hypothetical protein EYB58_17635 [Desulfobacter hydrogenophilus]RAL99885.1 hypothetical protein DO021_22040 [Desulfobacter hydrogenophilus]